MRLLRPPFMAVLLGLGFSPVVSAQETSLPQQAAAARVAIQGLVFLAAQREVSPQGKPLDALIRFDGRTAIDVARLPLLQDRRFVEAMADMLGQPLDAVAIGKLQARVNAYLQLSGQGLAYVSVPEQDASSGVVQVLVIQPRLGRLAIEGAVVFPESAYREAIRLQPGQVIDQRQLKEDLDWIRRSNSFRSAVVVAESGGQPGETDLTVRVTERRPWSFQVNASNTGTKNTRRERVGFGAIWGNAFGLGHIASYNLTANPELDNYVAHSLGYSVPLANRDILSFSATRADFEAMLPAPLDSTGYSFDFSANYERPLAPRGDYAHSLAAGIDFKRSNSNVLFSNTPVFDNTTEILQFGLGYKGSMTDVYGRTAFNLGLKYSPGGMTDANKDMPFNTSRALAKANYHYATLVLDRLTYLPGGWSWSLNARLQLASENLLGSEQLAVVGSQGVRGFEEGKLYADRGLVLRNELGPAPFRFSEQFQARAYGFVDAARVSNVNRVAGERSSTGVASLGLGLHLSFRDRLTAHLDLGRRLKSDIDGVDGKGSQLHLSLNYQF